MNLQSLPRFDSSLTATPSWSDARSESATAVCIADVVIVGGGIVGATLACCLADRNLRVVVVDAVPQSVGLKNQRAYALTLLTIDIFRELGIWSQIAPKVTGFTQICLSDAEYHTVVKFTPEDIGRSELGYVAEHRVILEGLYDRLAKATNITWIAPATVNNLEIMASSGWQALSLTLANDQPLRLEAPLVVGADGANSRLRQTAKIATWGWKYWQSCIGFTVQCDRPHQQIAYEKFWKSGPFAMLPLTDHRCQIVWTAPHAEAAALAELGEAEFLALLAQRYGVQPQELHLETPRQIFPVRLMQGQTYIAERLALIGDAAHCCHPVGGQGMNLGIRDAAALAEKILTAQHRGEDWGSRGVLQQYDRWRRWENWVILVFTDLLDRTFSTHFWPVVFLRHLGLWGLQRLSLLRWMTLHVMTGQFGRKPLLGQTKRRPR
ncbi:MAG: FAD-dependent hydroxylase [Prochlorotrichaceae cyanobacterium]|jgi:2-octaprenyl-6-methoxyphenol hydroxylase